MKSGFLAVALATVTSTMVWVVSCTTFDGEKASLGEGAGGGGGESQIDSQGGFLSLGDAVLLCSRVFTCPYMRPSVLASMALPLDDKQFSACVSWATNPLPANRPGRQTQAALLQCAAKGKTCAESTGCMWYEAVASDDPRCQGATSSGPKSCSTDGRSSLYACPNYIEHCDSPVYASGSVCTLDQASEPYCGVPATTCQNGSCEGNKLHICYFQGQPDSVIDCAALGYECGSDSVGQPKCLSNGIAKACGSGVALASAACSGDRVAVCDGDYIFEFDCTKLGGTCENLSGTPRCAVASDECSPSDAGIDACSGTSISLCAKGKKESFDCASLGLTCKPAAGKVSAYCG